MEEPGPLFCFATGDFEVICDDAPPNSGSGEGGEYEPVQAGDVVRQAGDGDGQHVPIPISLYYVVYQHRTGQ